MHNDEEEMLWFWEVQEPGTWGLRALTFFSLVMS